jgi:Uma2 family endonuclease
VIPDLVIEVVSSGDRMSEVGEKVQMWLDAGVRLIWVARPALRTIEIYRPGIPMLTLDEGDSLDGYDVVPGFSAPVSQVFG